MSAEALGMNDKNDVHECLSHWDKDDTEYIGGG